MQAVLEDSVVVEETDDSTGLENSAQFDDAPDQDVEVPEEANAEAIHEGSEEEIELVSPMLREYALKL